MAMPLVRAAKSSALILWIAPRDWLFFAPPQSPRSIKEVFQESVATTLSTPSLSIQPLRLLTPLAWERMSNRFTFL
jgi:hypothetical protein